LRALSLCTCCRHYPGAATGGPTSLIHPVVTDFPDTTVGSSCASSFSRIARRSLALRPAHSRCHQFVARLPEGFSHIVTSMTAPVASGWSGCRAGLAPAGKRRLCTAHVGSASSRPRDAAVHLRICPGLHPRPVNDHYRRALLSGLVWRATVYRCGPVARPEKRHRRLWVEGRFSSSQSRRPEPADRGGSPNSRRPPTVSPGHFQSLPKGSFKASDLAVLRSLRRRRLPSRYEKVGT
jgi:hypothetical protein